jgi:hypothetical protein
MGEFCGWHALTEAELPNIAVDWHTAQQRLSLEFGCNSSPFMPPRMAEQKSAEPSVLQAPLASGILNSLKEKNVEAVEGKP